MEYLYIIIREIIANMTEKNVHPCPSKWQIIICSANLLEKDQESEINFLSYFNNLSLISAHVGWVLNGFNGVLWGLHASWIPTDIHRWLLDLFFLHEINQENEHRDFHIYSKWNGRTEVQCLQWFRITRLMKTRLLGRCNVCDSILQQSWL